MSTKNKDMFVSGNTLLLDILTIFIYPLLYCFSSSFMTLNLCYSEPC